MVLVSNPIQNKYTQGVRLFMATDNIFSKAYNTEMSANIRLYNALVLDIQIKDKVSEVGGIKFAVSGRTESTESTVARYVDGNLYGKKITSNTVLSEVGRHKIIYDISAINALFCGISAVNYSTTLKVSDVVDIRYSLQNDSSVLPLRFDKEDTPSILLDRSTSVANALSQELDVRNNSLINIRVQTLALTTDVGYCEFYINAKNNTGSKYDLSVYDKNTGERLSGYIPTNYGYKWRLDKNRIYDLLFDTSIYNTITVNIIPYNGITGTYYLT